MHVNFSYIEKKEIKYVKVSRHSNTMLVNFHSLDVNEIFAQHTKNGKFSSADKKRRITGWINFPSLFLNFHLFFIAFCAFHENEKKNKNFRANLNTIFFIHCRISFKSQRIALTKCTRKQLLPLQ